VISGDWRQCFGDDAGTAIVACRAVIAESSTKGDELARAHLQLALALRKKGDLDAAIVSFTNSVEIVATAEALNGRGIAYIFKGQFNDALVDFDRAIQFDGAYGDALNNRAWVYFKTGRRREALADADKAVRLIPEKAYVWDTRGQIHEALGDAISAITDFEKALSLDPTIDSSKSALSRLTKK
jgi:tetratricopeptide (TPR) repeat protein